MDPVNLAACCYDHMADGGMRMLEHKLGQFDGGPGHLFYFTVRALRGS